MVLASLPSPTQGVWHLGPIPIRAYALCIIAGIVVAVWLTQRRWKARGGNPDDVTDVAMWAVPFGIVGGRLYHVITDPELYFAAGHEIRSGRSTSGTAAWASGGRSRSARSVPGSAAAAAASTCWTSATRWPRAWCWRRRSAAGATTSTRSCTAARPRCRGRCRSTRRTGPADTPTIALYHPTFLYESLWNIAVAVLLLWVDRRFTVPRGRLFALYVAAYTVGRGAIEALRVDHANHFLGLRLNDWTSLIVFLAALTVLCWRRRQPSSLSPAEPTCRGHESEAYTIDRRPSWPGALAGIRVGRATATASRLGGRFEYRVSGSQSAAGRVKAAQGVSQQ